MATRFNGGKACVRISSRLTASSGLKCATPVMFPPGCAMLVTTPVMTGSPIAAATMGMVFDAALAASVPGVP